MNTEQYKLTLEAKLKSLESELETVARRNPETPSGWEAIGDQEDSEETEEGDIAGEMEEFETNSAVFDQLIAGLAEVKAALGKIEAGTYGKCEVCGADIEADRLEANPGAKTCIAHMND